MQGFFPRSQGATSADESEVQVYEIEACYELDRRKHHLLHEM